MKLATTKQDIQIAEQISSFDCHQQQIQIQLFHFDSYTNKSACRHKKEGTIKRKMYVQRYEVHKNGEITKCKQPKAV